MVKTSNDIGLPEERAALYYEIGRSMSQWAHVEGQLRRTVADAVAVTDRVALGRAFLSLESFQAKRKFADHLLCAKHKGSTLEQRWMTLSDRLHRGAANRNKLAHYKPLFFADDAPGRRFVLVKWIREKEPERRGKVYAPQQAIGLMRVAEIRAEFHGLTTALANFREAAAGRPEPFPDSSQHTSSATDLRSVVDDMLRGIQFPRPT